jgi:hypothetical protein
MTGQTGLFVQHKACLPFRQLGGMTSLLIDACNNNFTSGSSDIRSIPDIRLGTLTNSMCTVIVQINTL